MFKKLKVKSLKYKTSALPNEQTNDFVLPALTAGIQNQGLNNYVPKDNATILKNVISISANGANTGATFYQSKEFTVLQDAYAIKWKNTNQILTDNCYLYLTASISKTIYGNYEWTNKAGWEKIKYEKIQLPIRDGEIDFNFMENFITELEVEHLGELEIENVVELDAYLYVTGLKDYNLTQKEQQVLEEFKQDKIDFNEYVIDDLFEIKSYKKRFDANKVNISDTGDPYVVRTSLNNGIRGYINEHKKYLNEGNTISFGQDTATMFYQEKPYFTGDKIKIIKSKNKLFNKENALFFITTMTKSFSAFSWGNASFNINIIKNKRITLPIKNNKPDYEAMENFISAIKKLVIKDIMLYMDRKISMTKTILNLESQ